MKDRALQVLRSKINDYLEKGAYQESTNIVKTIANLTEFVPEGNCQEIVKCLVAYLDADEYDKAVDACDAALEAFPLSADEKIDFSFIKIQALCYLGNYSKVLQCCEQIDWTDATERHYFTVYKISFYRSLALYALKEYQNSLYACEEVIKYLRNVPTWWSFPTEEESRLYYHALNHKALVLAALGQHQAALAVCDAVINSKNNYANIGLAYNHKANIVLSLGQSQEAEELFEKAEEKLSEDPGKKNLLQSYIYANTKYLSRQAA